jgi:hypothetical protein
MVGLVEVFMAAGLFVGAALQPAASTIAPKAIEIKVSFMSLSLPPVTYATLASFRQTGRRLGGG